jgi:hypothetical protein
MDDQQRHSAFRADIQDVLIRIGGSDIWQPSGQDDYLRVWLTVALKVPIHAGMSATNASFSVTQTAPLEMGSGAQV